MGKAKLDVLPVSARDEIAEYAKKNSLREVADFIKRKYNLDVSYVTVRTWLKTSYKRLPVEVQNLQYDLVLSAEDIIQKFNSLYSEASSLKARMVILSKYADYIASMMKFMPDSFPLGEKVEKTVKRTLEWQKKINE